MEIAAVPPSLPASAPEPAAAPDATMAAARAFEQTFLAEMLKHTGVNANSESFGGGAGEDAFAGFLTQEYARLLSERGGIGLAERIFEVLAARGDGA